METSSQQYRKYFWKVLLISGLSQACFAKDQKLTAPGPSGPALIKEYGAYRPSGKLILNREPKSSDNLELENDWFDVSYPSCFKVEPSLADADDITNKNSASVTFKRTEKCRLFKKDFDTVGVSFNSKVDENQIGRAEASIDKGPETAYAQLVSVNGHPGDISATIRTSDNKTFLFWHLYILCKGKRNEIFEIVFSSPHDLDLKQALKAKSFEIPEDYKSIASSFKCKTNR